MILPEYEVKLRECQHDDSEEGGEGSVHDGSEHVLQSQHCSLTPVAQTAHVEVSSLSLLRAFAMNSTTNCPVNPEAPKIT